MNQQKLREAVALHQGGKHDEAKRKYERLALQFPRDPDLLHFRGLLASHMGDQAESIRLIGEAIALKPGMPEFHQNLAISHQRAGDAKAAAAAFNEQGNALQTKRLLPAAAAAFEQSLALDPDNYRAAANYATTLHELGDSERALDILRRVEKQIEKRGGTREERSLILANMGNCHYYLGKPDRALKHYAEAIELDPGNRELHRNRASALLVQGKLQEGFAEYEWRCVDGVHVGDTQRDFGRPVWKGETPAQLNGALLILSEQGLGDVIQFARYVPLLARMGHRILFETKPELVALFTESWAGLDGVRVVREQPNGKIAGNLPFAAYVSLMSLPHILGTTLKTIPADTPYLGVAASRMAQWDKAIPSEGGLNVGLVWRGSAQTRHDYRRSMPAEALEPLLARQGVRFYSLQKGEAAKHQFQSGMVTSLDARLRDFTDTAAAIRHLDLVISIDSSVAHLAGALDCPVWLAMPPILDWRWLTDREDSPWYPKTRIFRQKTAGEWGPVIKDLDRALDKLAAKRRAA